jgi:hypothetical protein
VASKLELGQHGLNEDTSISLSLSIRIVTLESKLVLDGAIYNHKAIMFVANRCYRQPKL